MRHLLRNALLLCIIAAILFIFCPDKQDHADALQEAVKEQIRDFADNYGFSATEEDITEKAEEKCHRLYERLEVNQYYVCSIGRLDGKYVSFGICGHVFTSVKTSEPPFRP